MRIRKTFLVMMTFVSMVSVGCTYIVKSDWLANIPFEQGAARLFLGQEKWYPGGTYPYGSLSVKLTSPEKITDVKLLTSDIKIRFLKDGTIVKEMEIFLHDFEVSENNKIAAFISQYNKYITPAVDKKYSLNWDEFVQAAKKSDRIEYSISLKFKANDIIYLIKEKGILKQDVKGEFSRGIE